MPIYCLCVYNGNIKIWNKDINQTCFQFSVFDFFFFSIQLATTTESGHKPGGFAANYCASKQKYFGT